MKLWIHLQPEFREDAGIGDASLQRAEDWKTNLGHLEPLRKSSILHIRNQTRASDNESNAALEYYPELKSK